MKITRMTLLELSDAMQRGDLTSREVTQAYLDRIHQVEGKIQAYISLNEDEALRQADECDKKRQQGEKVSPLCGIPVAVKDNICVKGGKNHLRVQNAGGFRIAVLRHGLGEIAGGGLRPARQDESG